MTGTNYTGRYVGLTGNALIDGLTVGIAFAGNSFTYGFPRVVANYGSGYSMPGNGWPSELSSMATASDNLRTAIRFALEGASTASRGFGVEGLTNASFGEATVGIGLFGAHFRFSQASLPPNVLAYASPGGSAPLDRAGDVWLSRADFSDLRPGTLARYVAMHETGHALGLKHPHDSYTMWNGDRHPVLTSRWDAIEFTVMSYKSYVGEQTDVVGGVARFDHPQTWMMNDIRALQHIYGADFTTNAGNTVYKWMPGQGDTWVNGVRAIDGPGDTIFCTIWDGGGRDYYDLSAYRTAVRIDLRPGQCSVFDRAQLADLGYDDAVGRKQAGGNVYNAWQFGTNARSLIERANGGSGHDTLIGNAADNMLQGRGGNDALFGLGGDDVLVGGSGVDRFIFNRAGDGRDTVHDFAPDLAGEVIDLRGSATLTSFSQVWSRLVDTGAHVELRDTDGDVLVLLNVDKQELAANDFLF